MKFELAATILIAIIAFGVFFVVVNNKKHNKYQQEYRVENNRIFRGESNGVGAYE